MIQLKSTIGYYKANGISAPDEVYDASDSEFKIFYFNVIFVIYLDRNIANHCINCA